MHLNIWQGHKVRLRALTADDAEVIFHSHHDSDAWRHADDIKIPPTVERVRANISDRQHVTDDNIWLGIVDLEESLVGTINVHGADPRHKSFEYGIHLWREFRQHGFASEAVRLLMRFYFTELGYQRIWATVYGFNTSSMGLHHALGFKQEGQLRESVFTQGRYWDEFVFGLLAKEAASELAKLPPLPKLGDPADE